MKKIIILFIAVVGFGVSSFAQPNNTGTATANLISPITVAKNGTGIINFGYIVSGTPGTVTVDGNVGALRSATGGVVIPGGTAGGISASFTITGTAGLEYTVTLPASATVKHETLSTTMTINTFSCDVALEGTSVEGETAISSLDGTSRTFYVGARITLLGGEGAGVYTSDAAFPVTVAYN